MASFSSEQSRAGQAGFTLIEMIVVLVIMALVLALVVPNIGRGGGGYAVAAAARDVAVSLRLVRAEAIARGRSARFVVGGGSFGPSDAREWRRHVPRGIVLHAGAAQAEADDSDGGIRFFPDGSSSGGRVDVTDGTAHFAVSVAWLNGTVSIRANPARPER